MRMCPIHHTPYEKYRHPVWDLRDTTTSGEGPIAQNFLHSSGGPPLPSDLDSPPSSYPYPSPCWNFGPSYPPLLHLEEEEGEEEDAEEREREGCGPRLGCGPSCGHALTQPSSCPSYGPALALAHANGRAEVAVKLVVNSLRRYLAERKCNWVHALPLALWCLNDRQSSLDKLTLLADAVKKLESILLSIFQLMQWTVPKPDGVSPKHQPMG